ncbi:MAG: TolC family protein [Anaerotignaceae bacterium]
MKKRLLCILVASLTMCGSVFAFAGETEEIQTTQTASLYDTYSTMISVNDSSLTPITLDEVITKTINNSSSVKQTTASLELQEDSLEIAATELTYSSGADLSTVIALIKSQITYKNGLISQTSEKESLKYSVKQTYVEIIEAKRELELAAETIETDKKNLEIAKIQNKMGTLSDHDLNEQQLNYEKSLATLTNKEIALEADYIALNVLMGVDISNRYSFQLPVEYEELNLSIPLESYINSAVAQASSVKQKENSLSLAKQQFTVTAATSETVGSYASAENSLNTAEMNLADTKTSVADTLRNLYNTITESEISISNNIKELETLKEKLATAQTKYEMGTASLIELEQAQDNVASMENTIISSLYTHMLNVEKFNNPTLL